MAGRDGSARPLRRGHAANGRGRSTSHRRLLDVAPILRLRKIIVNIATSADGYVARPDCNLDWLTERPAPKGFYGLPEFERSTDAKILGRKTLDRSLPWGACFSAHAALYALSWPPQPCFLTTCLLLS